MDRREFINYAGSILLPILLNREETQHNLNITYIPDIHIREHQNKVVRYINNNLNKFDVLCLEGLEEKIDKNYIEEIKKARPHRVHVEKSLDKLIKEIDNINDKSFAFFVLKNYLILSGSKNIVKLECCTDVNKYLILNPGVYYALEFYSKIHLFGMEDIGYYKEVSDINSDYQDSCLYEFYTDKKLENKTEEKFFVEFMEKNFPLDKFKLATERIISHFGVKNLEEIIIKGLHNMDKTVKIERKREEKSIENILKKFPDKKVLVIMGSYHLEGLEKEARNKGIKFEIEKL